jgi:hypothetical protein
MIDHRYSMKEEQVRWTQQQALCKMDSSITSTTQATTTQLLLPLLVVHFIYSLSRSGSSNCSTTSSTYSYPPQLAMHRRCLRTTYGWRYCPSLLQHLIRGTIPSASFCYQPLEEGRHGAESIRRGFEVVIIRDLDSNKSPNTPCALRKVINFLFRAELGQI